MPGTRIIKAWNKPYRTVDAMLRSYHAEAILWHALTGKTTLHEAVLAFFDEAYDRLAPGARTLVPGSTTGTWTTASRTKSARRRGRRSRTPARRRTPPQTWTTRARRWTRG